MKSKKMLYSQPSERAPASAEKKGGEEVRIDLSTHNGSRASASRTAQDLRC
jgi:hypothetical protein